MPAQTKKLDVKTTKITKPSKTINTTKSIKITENEIKNDTVNETVNETVNINSQLSIEEKYKKKTHHEHILSIPDTYIGSVSCDLKCIINTYFNTFM